MTKKEPKPQPQAEKSVEEMVLDYKQDKYSAIPLAALWAKELHRREENRHMTAMEVLEKALHDVMSGVVDWKSARKFSSAAVEPGILDAVDSKKSKS
jgi:membrane carboxypeptidase/penicillin-binding protein